MATLGRLKISGVLRRSHLADFRNFINWRINSAAQDFPVADPVVFRVVRADRVVLDPREGFREDPVEGLVVREVVALLPGPEDAPRPKSV